MTEDEEFEFRHRLEQEQGLKKAAPAEVPAQDPSLMDAAKASVQNIASVPGRVAENLTPEKLSQQLPMLGGIAGSMAPVPVAGTAIGAGLGQIGKRLADLAYGRTQPGDAMNPASEAIEPMKQAAISGLAQGPALGVINKIPGVKAAGDLASRTGTQIGRGLARVGEAASGVKAQDIRQLFKNPGQLFKTGSRDQAGKAIGRAKELAGVNPGVTEAPISFTPENITKAIHSDSLGEDAILKVAHANLSGAHPEVEDIGDGLKYISKKIKDGINKGEDVSELINIQDHLNTVLEREAPGVQAARQKFAPLAQRDKFLKFLPTNKNGTISKANLFYLNSIAKGVTAPLRAPITTGLLTSAAGGAAKGLNAIAENPQIRAALAQVLQRIRQNHGGQE